MTCAKRLASPPCARRRRSCAPRGGLRRRRGRRRGGGRRGARGRSPQRRRDRRPARRRPRGGALAVEAGPPSKRAHIRRQKAVLSAATASSSSGHLPDPSSSTQNRRTGEPAAGGAPAAAGSGGNASVCEKVAPTGRTAVTASGRPSRDRMAAASLVNASLAAADADDAIEWPPARRGASTASREQRTACGATPRWRWSRWRSGCASTEWRVAPVPCHTTAATIAPSWKRRVSDLAPHSARHCRPPSASVAAARGRRGRAHGVRRARDPRGAAAAAAAARRFPTAAAAVASNGRGARACAARERAAPRRPKAPPRRRTCRYIRSRARCRGGGGWTGAVAVGVARSKGRTAAGLRR